VGRLGSGSGRGLGGWYVPHRAIILLGVLLTTVALAGASLGIVNSARAGQSTTEITNRYLVLQPPIRDIRSTMADFQVLAAKAFDGSTPPATAVAAAVADSTATDKAYLSLEHILTSNGDSGLSPHLASEMATYVAVRSKLGTFLAGEPPSLQSVQIAGAEEAAGAKLDASLAALQTTVTNRLEQTVQAAGVAANAARVDLLWSIMIGVLFALTTTTLLAGKALRVERESARVEGEQRGLTRRNEFEARLQRALEMSKSEAPVFELVAEALGEAAPGMHAELLLADSSRAHFRQVLEASSECGDSGCGVVAPDDCPAASRGQTMSFPSSTAIDACPNLRGRGCSALCVPVGISGSSVGVFHVTAADGTPPSEDVRDDIEVVGRRASERLALLRAFELSQTQANSDSLTGLMTRRSLESGIRELQASGSSYAVAYGDLDHFKQLNDVFGHDAGDRALRSFSQVLRDSIRPADIACRYGGEEFVIVLPSCPVNEALQVLERVRERMADRLATAQLPSFTVSFGLATSDQAIDFHDVVALADEALLGAKAGGRDQIVVASGAVPESTEPGVDGIVHPWDGSSLALADPDGLVAALHGESTTGSR
jgi:diguanylate cyclase (GGDEF)-like protein